MENIFITDLTEGKTKSCSTRRFSKTTSMSRRLSRSRVATSSWTSFSVQSETKLPMRIGKAEVWFSMSFGHGDQGTHGHQHRWQIVEDRNFGGFATSRIVSIHVHHRLLLGRVGGNAPPRRHRGLRGEK